MAAPRHSAGSPADARTAPALTRPWGVSGCLPVEPRQERVSEPQVADGQNQALLLGVTQGHLNPFPRLFVLPTDWFYQSMAEGIAFPANQSK